MAATILRLGRLGSFKSLQLQSWGILRRCSAVSFCSKSGEPEKRVKTKASSKTDAPNERAALLAYKTTVAFPIRLSKPGFFSAQSVGEAEPVVSSTPAEKIVENEVPTTVANEPTVAEPEAAAPISDPVPDQDVAEVIADAAIPAVDTSQTVDPLAENSRKSSVLGNTPVTGAAKDETVPSSIASSEPGDAAADMSSSSTSSDSDSDSDSDTEDEKSHVKTETTTSQPVVEATVKEEAHKVTDAAPEVDNAPPAVPLAQGQSPEKGQTGTLIKTADSVSAEADGNSRHEETPEPVCAEVETEAKHDPVDNVLEPAEAHAPAVETLMEDSPVKAALEPVGTEALDEVTPASAAAAKVTIHAESAEVLVDAAPIIAGGEDLQTESAEKLVDAAPVTAEAGGEDLQTEAPVDQSEEAAVVTPPEPEEPFDNSTYKNYQHHSYNSYTFADMDVEMAKFRLAQPSSGRPSPRH